MLDPQNRVWWWNLDRNGNPIDTTTLEPRKPDMPAIKDGSPYTPTFLVDGKLPPAHLHHKDGRIVGIHGESDLVLLQLTLLLCLRYEPAIINALSGLHRFDIMLHDVYVLLQLSRE